MPAHAGGMTRGPFIFIRPQSTKATLARWNTKKPTSSRVWIVTLLAVAAIMAIGHLCGLTSFWHVIYVLPGHENSQRLLRHERCHLEQIERDGRMLFSIKYLWWLGRYGYRNNPYEVEARAAEYA